MNVNNIIVAMLVNDTTPPGKVEEHDGGIKIIGRMNMITLIMRKEN